jgi:hypothetical protein
VENFLNLCWLLLALAALSAWLCLPAPRRSAGLGLVALLFVLVLMFPVISATDDLHPEAAAQAIEDASKRTQKHWIAINWLATHIKHGIAPALIVSPALVFQPTTEWLWEPASVPNSQPGFRLLLSGRPPPVRTS